MRNPNWDIFGEVKETVSVPSAAEYYGMSVRNGMTTCIFHEDRNPSMKLYDDHFYCFGCTEYGDVVKLTARLFGLTQYEAAKKLCSDFGIIHSRDKPIIRQKICVQSQREKEQRVFRIHSLEYQPMFANLPLENHLINHSLQYKPIVNYRIFLKDYHLSLYRRLLFQSHRKLGIHLYFHTHQ